MKGEPTGGDEKYNNACIDEHRVESLIDLLAAQDNRNREAFALIAPKRPP